MKKQLLVCLLALAAAACSDEDGWNEPVIPVTLKGIEAVNIDNSGEFPVVTDRPIKKEAYMIGIKWIADNIPDRNDDKFVSGPVAKGRRSYYSISDRYSKAIMCKTAFNDKIAAGSYVSGYFKEIDRDFLPEGIDEGLVLLEAPSPGQHSFRVEYYLGSELKFFYDTPTVEFF